MLRAGDCLLTFTANVISYKHHNSETMKAKENKYILPVDIPI